MLVCCDKHFSQVLVRCYKPCSQVLAAAGEWGTTSEFPAHQESAVQAKVKYRFSKHSLKNSSFNLPQAHEKQASGGGSRIFGLQNVSFGDVDSKVLVMCDKQFSQVLVRCDKQFPQLVVRCNK